MLDDPTFVWRAPLGVLALLALAGRDRARTGRWDRARELGFLFAVTTASIAYATAHDAVTWSISPEYFVIGKDLPDAATSFGPVVRLAALAGWSAGLCVGLVLLVANNPHRAWPRLPYRALAGELVRVTLVVALAGLLGGLVAPIALPSVAAALAQADVREPQRYVIAQGAHLGTYAGLGLALAMAWRRLPPRDRARRS